MPVRDGIGSPPPDPDGTEGTATVMLTLKNEHNEFKTICTLNGCIIKNCEVLKNFLNTKNQNTDYMIYFGSIGLPENWKTCLEQYTIKIHRFTKPDKDRFYTIVDHDVAKNSIIVKGCHIFLTVDMKKFKLKPTSKFPTFLKTYSKIVRCEHQIDRSNGYKGLIINDLAKFDKITLSLSNNNKLTLRDELFDKLVDGPLILNQDAVGWCAKAPDSSKITLHKFQPEGETVIIWKKSALEELNSNSSGQHSETPARTSNSNDEIQDTVDTSTTGSSQLRTSPVLLKDLIQKNPRVEDCLKNGLDYEYRLLSNWRHLAGKLKDPTVPPDIIDACKCNTIHSPTWEVLGRPDVSIKPVEELMKILNRTDSYARKDVFLELSNGIPEADRSKSIQDVLLNKDELMDKIAMKLDAPATRVTKNWKYFAPRLGIQQDDIDLIERGNNPAESLLKHVYSTLPAEKKTAGEFRRIIMGFDNRPDLRTFVKDVLEIASDDDRRPLKSVIPEDSEEMKKVTALLNKSTGGVKNWKNLAVKWKIDYSVYNTFDPPSKPSPTGTLLEWVCNNSQISVKAFLNILGEIKRYDVKEKMEAKIIRKCN